MTCDVGNGAATVDLPVPTDDFEICFNGRFLDTILANLTGDTIIAQFNRPTQPVLFNGDGPVRFLLMPIKLADTEEYSEAA